MTHPSNLPYMICYMASSIDGKIIVERFSKSFYPNKIGSEYHQYGEEILHGQAMMMGLTTLHKDFVKTLYEKDPNSKPATNFEPFQGKHETKAYTIFTDIEGTTRYDVNQVHGNDLIAILGETVSEEYLQHLRDRNVSYVFAGKDGHDMKKALATLKSRFGLERILLQGGGNLNGSFLQLKLIDEIAILVVPCIDGLHGVTSTFSYAGAPNDMPAEGQKLELLSAKTCDGGKVLLRYKIHKEE